VAADDSINSVLARITASAAGVTASYDDTTELLTLTAKNPGTGPIVVGGDSSGFLAAVKLDGTAAASVASVGYSPYSYAIGAMSEYASVTAGTLTINGHDIAVDPATTTVLDLVNAIDAIDGVSAEVNLTNGAIAIAADGSGAGLVLADTSGILDAIGLATGVHGGGSGSGAVRTRQTGVVTVTNASDVADDVAKALGQLNAAVADLLKTQAGDAGFASELGETLMQATDFLRDAGVRGLDVERDGDTTTVALDRSALMRSMDSLRDGVDVARAIDGLVERLDAGVAAAAGWDAAAGPSTQTLRLQQASRARLTADHAQAALFTARTAWQPVDTDEMTMKAAVSAYTEASS
jgi:hypothetical protein